MKRVILQVLFWAAVIVAFLAFFLWLFYTYA